MSKLVAIMSMSLDGYVADRNDGMGEVFDWYFNSGDVEFHAGAESMGGDEHSYLLITCPTDGRDPTRPSTS